MLLMTFSYSGMYANDYKRIENIDKEKVWIVAHRALTGEGKYPENSLATIESCIKHELAVIEIDIRETRDGELVVIHDKTIDRTTNGKGNVEDYTLAELKKFNLTHDGVETPYHIPTLEEVFKIVKGKIKVDLDIKFVGIRGHHVLADLLKKHKLHDQMIIFLYSKDDLSFAKELYSKSMIMPRARSLEDVNFFSTLPYIDIIHIDDKSYDDIVMKNLMRQDIRIWKNALGHYDSLEKEGQDGFKNFFETYPYINVVQTDLGVQLKDFLKTKFD